MRMYFLLINAINALIGVILLWLYYRWNHRRIIQLGTQIGSDKLQMILGFGPLVTPAINEWQPHRKQMDVAFKLPKVIEFIPIFHKRLTELFAEMDKCHIMENSYDILLYCREYTFGISAETMLGRDTEKHKPFYTKLLAKLTSECVVYISDLLFKSAYQLRPIVTLADKTIYKEEQQNMASFRRLIGEAYTYYASGLRNNPEYLNSQDIAVAKHVNDVIKNNILDSDLAITSMLHLFGASFETSSSTLYFTMIMLAMHPNYQAIAYAEICQLFPDNDNGEFNMSYEHTKQLTYLDMFIKETMRLFPSLALIGRIADGDLILRNGIVIPKGVEIGVSIYDLHRSKDIWGPQADKFNPDNFLPSNVEARHPYAFIPFSKGKRSCIGMRYAEISLKVAMAKIIKRYKFSTTIKLEEIVVHNKLSLQLVNHPPLTIERRTNLSG
ncbi:probable cytochrome P450 313a4 isoform X2 [Musca autumnalis]|uniref:probable cytochrome P450 313a4 isoform X2 n=1 Tax=Musca autumnalis TaxID=221902 RepID=UPI003CEE62E1